MRMRLSRWLKSMPEKPALLSDAAETSASLSMAGGGVATAGLSQCCSKADADWEIHSIKAGPPGRALRCGGVLDTVVENVTGVFFDESTPEALARAVERADTIAWDGTAIRRQAERYSRAVFERRLGEVVTEALAARRARRRAA